MSEYRMRLNIEGKTPAPGSRFTRCRSLLYSTAFRLLHSRREAEKAVENCLLVASRAVPTFDSEGAFRSWLVRILINEALEILHRKRIASTISGELVCSVEF